MRRYGRKHPNYKHGLGKHPLHSVWASMKFRCNTTKGEVAEKWHDRGIRVCIRWQNFLPFYRWSLRNGYKKGLTLDRINNDGDYKPSNCRWTTWSIQNSNKRKYKSMQRQN
jgi:hypothetical protein